MSSVKITKSRQHDFEDILDLAGCIAKIILKADKNQTYNIVAEELDKSSLYWLVFSSDNGFFSIACEEKEIDFFSLKKLQKFISQSFDADFKIYSDIFCPEQFNSFYAYQLRSENSARLLIVYSRSLATFRNLICRNMDFVLNLDLYRLKGEKANFLTDSFMFCLDTNKYVINRTEEKSIFECKEIDTMEDDMQLMAAVKIGILQITVADFIKLKVGSQIEFDMPDDIAVEVEVENNLFAKGQLSTNSEGRAFLKIGEMAGLSQKIIATKEVLAERQTRKEQR